MRSILLLVLVVCVTCYTHEASAQRRARSQDGAIASNPLAAIIDENNDGVLSAREIRYAGNQIRKLDKNGDGKITDDELGGSDADPDAVDEEDDEDDRPPRANDRKPRGRNVAASDESRLKAKLDESINQAATFYRQKKYDEAGDAVQDALDVVEQVDDPKALASMMTSIKRLERAHQLISKQGVELPDFPDTDELLADTRPAPTNARPSTTSAEEETTTQGVSFTKQIAPIFVKRCAGCHISKQEGKLSLASYSDLLKGSGGGAVFEEGNAVNSIIVDMVASGEMPPKGGPIPDAEIQLLSDWVDEGGNFDGDDEGAPIKK